MIIKKVNKVSFKHDTVNGLLGRCGGSLGRCGGSLLEMWWLIVEMWWLIGSSPDFWGRGSGFESGISHNDPDALQDHCVIM